jgi:acyl-CoA thioesterase-2
MSDFEGCGSLVTEEGAAFLELPLRERLELSRTGESTFVGTAPAGYTSRVYGGHLLGQALLAAGRTVPSGRDVLSMQAYFLRPGDPSLPLGYTVRSLRDGRSFSARVVEVTQGDRLLMSLQSAFLSSSVDDASPHRAPMPQVPEPECLDPLHVRRSMSGKSPDGFNWVPGADWRKGSRPLDIRYVDPEDARRRCFWMRVPTHNGTQAEHRSLLAFASDRSLLPTILHARGALEHRDHLQVASVDHAMWFHADVTAGEWWLYVQESPAGTSRMGLATGSIYTREGALVATVQQQGLVSGSRA